MDTVHHCDTDEEWQEACRQAKLRSLYHRNPRVRAARKAYKQALVRGVPEREAWAAANAVYKAVRTELTAKLAKERF